MATLNLLDQPFPEPKRFGVGIVDPENLHSLINPEQHYIAECVPQATGVFRRKVGIDDVLVFLRRILRIAHRAIGAPLEPFWVLFEPGVIRSALHSEVERDFHSKRTAGRDEIAEILQGAQFRMQGVMAAFSGADRIGAAGIVFGCGYGIISTLAIDPADRVDGREIDHVKSHRPDIG